MVLLDSKVDDGEDPLPDLVVVGFLRSMWSLMTDRPTETGALAAVARGASNLLSKPLEPSKVRQLVWASLRRLKCDDIPWNLDTNYWKPISFRVW